MSGTKPIKIGVIVVSFGSDDVISDCLQSLAASRHNDLVTVVCDNASPDNSNAVIRAFAKNNNIELSEIDAADVRTAETTAPGDLTLLRSPENLGYAGAVNLSLDYLLKSMDIDYFWILNPDSVVEPDTAEKYAAEIAGYGDFSLMSGRTLYFGEDGMIQSDGGRVNLWTGICSNVNFGRNKADVEMPGVDELDYLSGANMIASRQFVERVGKMREDYFLYYEEVDWAMRRGDLPLVLCHDAVVYHHGGTSIGSGTTRRRHTAFANYFNFRNRARFVWRFRPWAYPVAYIYSVLKILKLLSIGAAGEASAAWCGLNNFSPPKEVADRIDASSHEHAFGRRQR